MKVAILISGLPRFTREFDDFLDSLTGYTQLDWYFLFWKISPSKDLRIPPSWPYDDELATRHRIEPRLPKNSSIINLSIVNEPTLDSNRSFNITPWTIVPSILSQLYGIKQVNLLREQHESRYGSYDLVIRARPDVGVNMELDLTDIAEQLIQAHPTLLMGANHRHGLAGRTANDLFAIGVPTVMSTYARLYNCIDAYAALKLPFTPETYLAHHLAVNNIDTPITELETVFRYYTSDGKNAWINDHYVDFGRWNTD